MTALLTQLAEMRSADPTAKAVVFSAWGRLLKLVGDALASNGLQYVSLAGAQPPARAEALRRFIHDPDCAVILIVLSTGGEISSAVQLQFERGGRTKRDVAPCAVTLLETEVCT